MMKKLLSTLLVAIFLLWTAPVLAQEEYGLEVSADMEATGIAFDETSWVYKIAIFADATNSYMGLYNVNTTTELQAASEPEDEIGEATQWDTAERSYEKPVYYSDGVGVVIFTGVGFIWRGPQP